MRTKYTRNRRPGICLLPGLPTRPASAPHATKLLIPRMETERQEAVLPRDALSVNFFYKQLSLQLPEVIRDKGVKFYFTN